MRRLTVVAVVLGSLALPGTAAAHHTDGMPRTQAGMARYAPDLYARTLAERPVLWSRLRLRVRSRWVDQHPAAEAAHRAAQRSAPPGWAEANVRVSNCESGGNLRAYSSAGPYLGKWQFDQGTWESAGGTGDPRDASEREQDYRAFIVVQARGWAPWPVCGKLATRVS